MKTEKSAGIQRGKYDGKGVWSESETTNRLPGRALIQSIKSPCGGTEGASAASFYFVDRRLNMGDFLGNK